MIKFLLNGDFVFGNLIFFKVTETENQIVGTMESDDMNDEVCVS